MAGVSAEQPSEAALLSGGDTEAIRLGSSMAALASETGGRTFTVAPDLRQRLEVVRRDLATYYSLGYHPANEEPGRKRRIEVRVRRPDVRVLARTQLADPEAADRLSDTAVTALLAEEGGANPLGIVIDVRPGAAAERRRGAALVPVEVRVPLARVTLLPDGARHRAQLTFQFAARDPDGGFRRLESRPLAFDVPNDRLAQALSQSVTFRVEIPFAPGSHRLAAAVLDELAGTLSTATAPVVVALR